MTLPRLKAAVKASKTIIGPRLLGTLGNRPEEVGLIAPEHEALLLPHLLQAKAASQVRTYEWHPSSLDGCHRQQVFSYIGVPAKSGKISPGLQMIFIDGTWRHVKWQTLLLNAGIATDIEVGVRRTDHGMVGSIDAVSVSVPGLPDAFGIEIKGTSMFQTVKQYGILSHHAKQMHAYMFLSGLPMFLAIYEDKATQEWCELPLYADAKHHARTERTLNELNQYIIDDELPPILPECVAGEGAYKGCAYAYACKQLTNDTAQVASGCASSEEVVTKLNLKRRNTHGPRSAGIPSRRWTSSDQRIDG